MIQGGRIAGPLLRGKSKNGIIRGIVSKGGYKLDKNYDYYLRLVSAGFKNSAPNVKGDNVHLDAEIHYTDATPTKIISYTFREYIYDTPTIIEIIKNQLDDNLDLTVQTFNSRYLTSVNAANYATNNVDYIRIYGTNSIFTNVVMGYDFGAYNYYDFTETPVAVNEVTQWEGLNEVVIQEFNDVLIYCDLAEENAFITFEAPETGSEGYSVSTSVIGEMTSYVGPNEYQKFSEPVKDYIPLAYNNTTLRKYEFRLITDEGEDIYFSPDVSSDFSVSIRLYAVPRN